MSPLRRFLGLFLFVGGALLGVILAGVGVGSLGGDASRAARSPSGAADLIVVLGGGWGARTQRGAELYAAGNGERVLVTGVYDGDRRADQLTQAGVPSAAIILNRSAKNTWQEAHFLRLLMDNNGWRRALVITDPPHLARVRWSLDQAFSGSPLAYELVSSEPSWWNAERWWTNPTAVNFVADEVVKGVYYRVRYGSALVRRLLE